MSLSLKTLRCAVACLALAASPVSARAWKIAYSGDVRLVQLGDEGDLKVGDPIVATFSFDEADAKLVAFADDPTLNIFDVKVKHLRVALGQFTYIAPEYRGTLYVSNDRLGLDAITFLFQFEQPGPFGSRIANIQIGGKDFSQTVLNDDSLQIEPVALMEAYFNSGFISDTGNRIVFGDWDRQLRVAAVPETATWAAMLAGFALAGTALRHRRMLGSLADTRS